jgi:hypothetical protein
MPRFSRPIADLIDQKDTLPVNHYGGFKGDGAVILRDRPWPADEKRPQSTIARNPHHGRGAPLPPHPNPAGISMNGDLLDHAQQMAAHESARTTKLYDRRSDKVTLDEVEKIML